MNLHLMSQDPELVRVYQDPNGDVHTETSDWLGLKILGTPYLIRAIPRVETGSVRDLLDHRPHSDSTRKKKLSLWGTVPAGICGRPLPFMRHSTVVFQRIVYGVPGTPWWFLLPGHK